jgi:ABC-type transporter Mla subunit MlaD
MTTDEKIDRLTDLVGGIGDGLNSLSGVVKTLATTVAAHDDQIEALIQLAEKNEHRAAEQRKEFEQLVREWHAYLRTIRPQ